MKLSELLSALLWLWFFVAIVLLITGFYLFCDLAVRLLWGA